MGNGRVREERQYVTGAGDTMKFAVERARTRQIVSVKFTAATGKKFVKLRKSAIDMCGINENLVCCNLFDISGGFIKRNLLIGKFYAYLKTGLIEKESRIKKTCKPSALCVQQL